MSKGNTVHATDSHLDDADLFCRQEVIETRTFHVNSILCCPETELPGTSFTTDIHVQLRGGWVVDYDFRLRLCNASLLGLPWRRFMSNFCFALLRLRSGRDSRSLRGHARFGNGGFLLLCLYRNFCLPSIQIAAGLSCVSDTSCCCSCSGSFLCSSLLGCGSRL